MGVYSGPNLVKNGLVLSLDAKNIRSIPIRPKQHEHGISDWIAMDSGTATYSAIYPNTSIYEIDITGNESLILTTGSEPERGTFSVVAGRRYYGTFAIHLMIITGNSQHKLVPLSLSGLEFGYYVARNSPGTLFLYSPFEDATVNIYENVTNGINGTPTSIVSVPKSGVVTTTISVTTGHTFFKSDYPIVASGTQSNGVDRMIIPPAVQQGYKIYGMDRTVINTVPSTDTNLYISDNSNLVFSTTIADGAGGDSCMHLGLEHLSDTYSFGGAIPDFEIIAPYPNTLISVSYKNNGNWVLGESFSLNGSIVDPVYVARDGTNGFGVNATILSGAANPLGSGSTLWKFEGNNPFLLHINDNTADEEPLLGWSSKSTQRRVSNQDIKWKDLGNFNRDFTIFGNPLINDNGYITFDNNQVTQYIWRFPYETPIDKITYSCWFRSNFHSNQQTPFTYSVNGNNEMLFFISNSTALSSQPKGLYTNITTSNMQNQWVNFTWSRDSVTGENIFYKDGVRIGSIINDIGVQISPNGHLIIGQEADAPGGGFDQLQNLDGDFARLDIYDRVLTEEEVTQNFNSLKSRFI